MYERCSCAALLHLVLKWMCTISSLRSPKMGYFFVSSFVTEGKELKGMSNFFCNGDKWQDLFLRVLWPTQKTRVCEISFVSCTNHTGPLLPEASKISITVLPCKHQALLDWCALKKLHTASLSCADLSAFSTAYFHECAVFSTRDGNCCHLFLAVIS